MSLGMLFSLFTPNVWLDFLNSWCMHVPLSIAKRGNGLECGQATEGMNHLTKERSPNKYTVVAVNKHQQIFLARGIITIQPIETGYGTVNQSIRRSIKSRRLAAPLFAVGDHVGRPLCRQASNNTPAVFLDALLVVSFFNLRFLSA